MSKPAEQDVGQKLDPELAHGPIENRTITDPICCLIFLCAVIAAFIIAFVGFGRGNPKLLAVPYDPDGRSCGIDLPDHPYIYFVTPTTGYLNRTTCVKSCPVYQNETQREAMNLDCVTNKIVLSCNRNDYEINDAFSFKSKDAAFLNSSVFVYNTTGCKK